jgi:hypothetical protein
MTMREPLRSPESRGSVIVRNLGEVRRGSHTGSAS